MKNIVIIGGGFGGLYTALYLRKLKNISIILFNKNNYFLFTPLLHEVATGLQNRHNIVLEIRKILKHIKFYATKVSKIDFNEKSIYFNNNKVHYDKLIIAIGSKPALNNIKNADKYAIPLKNIKDATKIKNKIIRSLEKASISNSEDEVKKLLTFVIIGGGPTGVELAGEISDFINQIKSYYKINNINIYLIHRGNKIIPQLLNDKFIIKTTEQLKKKNVNILLNTEVTEILEDGILINKNHVIKTYNIFYTAGVIPNSLNTTPKLTNEKGFYEVNEFFEVTNNVYAIGDCALNFNPGNNKPNQFLAQLAVNQAKHLAENIYLESKGKNKIPFIFKPKGFLVSVGSWWAVAEIKKLMFKGRFAWWIWRTIYLSKMPGLKNKIKIGIEWFMLLFSKRDASEI